MCIVNCQKPNSLIMLISIRLSIKEEERTEFTTEQTKVKILKVINIYKVLKNPTPLMFSVPFSEGKTTKLQNATLVFKNVTY